MAGELRTHASRICVLAALACLLLHAGCGAADAEQHERAVEGARASLDGDPSGALFQARDALDAMARRGEDADPRLQLIAAEACIRLDRRTDALEYATDGLTAADLDPDLKADLFWARGVALMGRYRELNDETDWRAANSTLEKAAEGGRHQLDAALLLVGLQDLGNHSNPERQLKYARLVIQLDTEGSKAKLVRNELAKKGLSP